MRSSAALLSFLATSVSAFRIPFERRASSSSSSAIEFTNAPLSNTSFNFGDVSTNGDSSNIYVGTIVVDGHNFEVQMDSGSSDLWLATQNVTLSSAYQDTGKVASITYGDGTVASGHVLIGEVQFGNFTASKQAFISALKTNATTDADQGLLGMGPPLASSIEDTLNGTAFNGQPLLSNIFAADENLPNFYSLELTRNDLATTSGGVFTIGDVNPNFTAVLQSPKLPVIMNEFWAVFMSGVRVGDDLLTGNSIVDPKDLEGGITPPTGSTVVLLDSGTSLAQGSKVYVDKMYSGIQGASFNESVGLWQLPCEAQPNISFVFGTQSFPLNPIDATFIGIVQGSNTFCFGSFAPVDAADSNGFDFILGDSFMRNIVTVFNFGDFTDPKSTVKPFLQIMSTVNITQANAEFIATNGARQTRAIKLAGESDSSASSSSGSSSNHSLLGEHIGIIIAVVAGVIALLLGGFLYRRRRATRPPVYGPVGAQTAPPPGAYAALNETHYELPPYPQQQQQPYPQQPYPKQPYPQ